jgi:hypothetical protein
MIWFVIAVVLIAAGVVMIRLSRAEVARPPLPPPPKQPENLFEPTRHPDWRADPTSGPGSQQW